MSTPHNTPVNMRKKPKQSRSQTTIDAILEATIQLLQSAEPDSISTNHIAERAGVSIGTVYQYFPNKSAIYLALAQRDRDARFKIVADALLDARPTSTEDWIRQVTRALISSFKGPHNNIAVTMLVMTSRAKGPGGLLPVDEIARLLTQKDSPLPDRGPLSEATAFVLTRATLWPLVSATLDAPHLLDDPEFEERLVQISIALL